MHPSCCCWLYAPRAAHQPVCVCVGVCLLRVRLAVCECEWMLRCVARAEGYACPSPKSLSLLVFAPLASLLSWFCVRPFLPGLSTTLAAGPSEERLRPGPTSQLRAKRRQCGAQPPRAPDPTPSLAFGASCPLSFGPTRPPTNLATLTLGAPPGALLYFPNLPSTDWPTTYVQDTLKAACAGINPNNGFGLATHRP